MDSPADESARLDEYRAYYRARVARARAHDEYPAAAEAEARLADAVEQATSMADLQQRILAGGLALACGTALAGDQARARAALFARTAEDVHARGPAEVLAGLDQVADSAGLVALGSGAAQREAQAVTVDELTRLWTSALTDLENIEVWRTARVPDRWRSELDGHVAEATASARDAWRRTTQAAAQHSPGWRLDDDTARAPRHRRLVPVPDEAFEARLAEHRRIVRGEAG
ncbi:MAG: hypothetical protein ACJ72D_10175 [Marmoricola sp.]